MLLCGLTRAHRVLDLGCGPAPLGVALAPFVREVVAVDPEPAMLKAAAEHAARAGVSLRLIESTAEQLGAQLGTFRMAAIGRAFHWMDRGRVLAELDAQIEPEGAVALFGSRHIEGRENAWLQPFRDLLSRYAVDNAARARRDAPDWRPHEAVLLDSPFDQLERISVIERRSTPVDAFIDRAFSMSSTAPGRLGAKAQPLSQELRELMDGYAAGGAVVETVETDALIAHRAAA